MCSAKQRDKRPKPSSPAFVFFLFFSFEEGGTGEVLHYASERSCSNHVETSLSSRKCVAEVMHFLSVSFRMSKTVRSTMNRTFSSELQRKTEVGALWQGEDQAACQENCHRSPLLSESLRRLHQNKPVCCFLCASAEQFSPEPALQQCTLRHLSAGILQLLFYSGLAVLPRSLTGCCSLALLCPLCGHFCQLPSSIYFAHVQVFKSKPDMIGEFLPNRCFWEGCNQILPRPVCRICFSMAIPDSLFSPSCFMQPHSKHVPQPALVFPASLLSYSCSAVLCALTCQHPGTLGWHFWGRSVWKQLGICHTLFPSSGEVEEAALFASAGNPQLCWLWTACR